MTPAEAAKLTVPKLKAELTDRGLETSGLKAVLLARLLAALAEPEEAAASAAAEPDNAPDLLRDGRFVDFLEQDISSFDDAEVGAAARIVHGGCRKALHAHAEITTVRAEDEETTVEVTEGIDTGEVKLTGNVGGDPPYRGVLRHRGWRARGLSLPTAVAGHDATVVAPAEVEL